MILARGLGAEGNTRYRVTEASFARHVRCAAAETAFGLDEEAGMASGAAKADPLVSARL
ncbi:hypothetical protein DSL72_002631 [Monilinia vaccinii-corymbosi]|uniref:Uncharacterized protein n=1 Tax=Monilinia vaccinii-corymbosi TaxID=61207 RepID=A0A8A3PD90_9HELO|nr:hypothetical protein DSL72_002631 [Monilinia vaccinii-corymbosi]